MRTRRHSSKSSTFAFPSTTSLPPAPESALRHSTGGASSPDFQPNWRVGGTLAFPVDARNSVKLYASSGVSARTGNNFDLLGLAWQYRWGGGL